MEILVLNQIAFLEGRKGTMFQSPFFLLVVPRIVTYLSQDLGTDNPGGIIERDYSYSVISFAAICDQFSRLSNSGVFVKSRTRIQKPRSVSVSRTVTSASSGSKTSTRMAI